ncbi:conserved hypothetical protein [Candidatus Defluviicoccus seviourii]|uniref:Adenosylcobinamide amidohydrolase n=1 Tax=Candidatus Defluviicoccus seviourii TaxID=2565273 RepID=A0A564WBU9_9PROT|nr:conserved hypothetical protein [Candidatus Defluviicoccus seviourii]
MFPLAPLCGEPSPRELLNIEGKLVKAVCPFYFAEQACAPGQISGPGDVARPFSFWTVPPMDPSQQLHQPAFTVCSEPGWLVAAFDRPQRLLSWSINRPGFQQARRVAWTQVRDSDLPVEVDAAEFLAARLLKKGLGDAIGLMTSGELNAEREAIVSGGVRAECLVTLGLSNAERVGQRFTALALPQRTGTINMLCHVSTPLSDAALIEAISLATQARTVAILDFGYERVLGAGAVTGTGTDCVVIGCPVGSLPARFAGMHTLVGEILGAAVLQATRRAMRQWLDRQGAAAS